MTWCRRFRVKSSLSPKFVLIARIWPLLAFLFVAFACRHELRQIRYSEVIAAIPFADPIWIGLAIVLTLASLAVMGLYDVICFQSANVTPSLRWKRGMLAFGWSNFLTIGPLAGPAIRFWLYRNDTFEKGNVAQGVFSIAIGFTVGLGLWAIASWTGVQFSVQLATVILVAWLLGSVFRRFQRFNRLPDRFRHANVAWRVLFLVGVADWLIALTVYECALRSAGLAIPFRLTAQTFFAGQIAGLLSFIPGGLGTADSIWISQLNAAPAATSALLLYRVIYYLAPWAVASMLLFRGVVRHKVRWNVPARSVISFLVAASGVVLLVSAATPALRYRLAILHRWVPLAALETSHLTTVLTGMILIVLAAQLKKGYRDAFLVTMSLLMVGAVGSVLKGLDVEEAWLLFVTAMILYAHEPLFIRPGSAEATGWNALIPVLLAVAIYAGVGLTAYPQLNLGKTMWLTVRFGAQAARYLRALGVLSLIGILVVIDSLMRIPSRFNPPDEKEIARALRIFRQHGSAPSSSALTAANRDKSIFFGPKESFSLYRTIGRYVVVFSDPIVADPDLRIFTSTILDKARELDRALVFYQISSKWMSVLHDFGYMFFKLGEEAIIDLSRFNIRGNKGKAMRNVLNRFGHDGFSFRVLRPDEISQHLSALKAVSDAWLNHKGISEKQFSIGYFHERYLTSYPCAVVVNKSAGIIAFANILSGNPRGEFSIDLMRYIPDCPNGVMDFLMLNILTWGTAEGYTTFNMGMAPLSTVGQRREAHLRERLANWLFRRGEQWYNFRGLRHFKEKYDPVWTPRYMAYPRSWEWPLVIAHVTRLISTDPLKQSWNVPYVSADEDTIGQDVEVYTS